jgi:hypothetical protein
MATSSVGVVPESPARRGIVMRYLPVGAAAAAAAGGYATLYRLGQTWGATNQERQQALVGDELLPNARAWTTHAITIEAPAPNVWPWLAQMGWGRAGWYTYRWVDRLCSRPTAPALTGSSRSSSGCRRAAGSLTVLRRWIAGSPWSASSRAGCWCCGRPRTYRCLGAGTGCRWSGSGVGIFTSRPRVRPGSSSAIACVWTHGGSSGRSWPRSSQRTSSWRGVTCAASGTASRARRSRQSRTAGSRTPRVCSAAWRCSRCGRGERPAVAALVGRPEGMWLGSHPSSQHDPAAGVTRV